MKGRIKAGEGTLVGNAGECYVMAELLKRGVIAGLTPRNTPAFDILATRNGVEAKIRVKTKSEDYDIWQWNTHKDGTVFRLLNEKQDFVVLVHLAMEPGNLRFYIVPTHTLSAWLTEDHKKWEQAPGKNGRPHSKENRKRHLHEKKHADFLSLYLNSWDSLWR